MRADVSSEGHCAELPAFTDVLQIMGLSAFLSICRKNPFEWNNLLRLLSWHSACPCFSQNPKSLPPVYKGWSSQSFCSCRPDSSGISSSPFPGERWLGESTWVFLSALEFDKNLQAPFGFSQPYLAQTRMKKSSSSEWNLGAVIWRTSTGWFQRNSGDLPENSSRNSYLSV